MAGTVVIDCSDLIVGDLVDDELEQAIGAKLQTARDDFYKNQASGGEYTPNQRNQESIFKTEGGILAHLIGMVKDDIETQRMLTLKQKIDILEKQVVEETKVEKKEEKIEEISTTSTSKEPVVEKTVEKQTQHTTSKIKSALVNWGLPILAVAILLGLIFGR